MTTIYFKNGTCALGPHIVLEWIGAPYEAKVGLPGTAELLALNPAGAVPVLVEDDGWVLTQNSAIMDYLVGKHPEAGLGGGQGLRAAAERAKWCAFITGDLHPAFYPVFMADRYTTDPSDAAKKHVQEAGLKLARKKFAILDAHLQGREWMLDGRSVCDAYLFPMIRWGVFKLGEGMKDYPNVMALHDRLAADPAVQKVLAVHAASAKAA